MGCIASKHAVSVTPALDHSGAIRDQSQGGILASSLRNRAAVANLEKKKHGDVGPDESTESGKTSSNGTSSLSFRLQSLHKYMEGEQVAAGWPAWLSAVAGEAIQGWVPLQSDSFEKLEKIGQGTYSSVFRAREIETGKIVALKKVRFDNYEPESVRFMAREIKILRRLEHPNIVKLEGLITSRLSCSIYLVFEYMEHDLAGLSSCPDIQFTESQVKCYMQQLLSGLQHCHSRGIMHRDIKGANLLVNNEGILKIADFGLANFSNPGRKHPLTSRVVTLWYRPPELLLGSTDYGASVDLWSVGCVFAELLLGKPILQGRTEVEQLHKIFKLCGSPPDEYWKKSKLPHATIFKPHQPYESCLREACKSLPGYVLGLIETLLSVEPYKRGTASSALESEYFATEPYACEPSNLPKYPPNKEIDAKSREESRRKKAPGRANGSKKTARGASRAPRPMREPNGLSRLASRAEELKTNSHGVKNGSLKHNSPSTDGDCRLFVGLQPVSTMKPQDDTFHIKHSSGEDIPFSGPLPVPSSGGFAWAKKTKESDECLRSNSKRSSKGHQSGSLDPSSILRARHTFDSKELASGEPFRENRVSSKGHEAKDLVKRAMVKQRKHLERPDSFDASEDFHSQELSEDFYFRDEVSSRRSYLNFQQDQEERVEFSGPLLSQSCKVDELLAKHERHIRQAVRRSWFQKGRKEEKHVF